MRMLRNFEKRRELQQGVYGKYTPDLTGEEKKELENEVGAAFRGYATALRDIAQVIVDGKGVDDIKAFVTEQYNGKATKNLFRFSELCSTRMKDYLRTVVKEELLRQGCDMDDADVFIETFINYPDTRQELIDEWDLNTIRICEHCGRPMHEGYLVNDFDTYCSEECVKAARHWSDEQFTEQTLYAADRDDSTIYWTKWEG